MTPVLKFIGHLRELGADAMQQCIIAADPHGHVGNAALTVRRRRRRAAAARAQVDGRAGGAAALRAAAPVAESGRCAHVVFHTDKHANGGSKSMQPQVCADTRAEAHTFLKVQSAA